MVTLPPQALDFEAAFRAFDANHRPPLKWQTRLYERFVRGGQGDVPGVCSLPTGLGKTSVIPIWLIALCGGASGAQLPRRLVYIVNRRTVVDQATDDAKRLLARLYRSGQQDGLAWATEEAIKKLGLESEPLPSDHAPATKHLRLALDALCTGDPTQGGQTAPLAVSTLRGELADNGEWKKNPARPAIIIGTVDMIGSKLLFSGYGDGRYGRANHAGLIGQDALVVHDEAHLSPAFDVLIRSVAAEQARCGESRPIRVMSLSATTRGGTAGSNGGTHADSPFSIEDEDRLDHVVSQRLGARKSLTIVDADKGKVVTSIAEEALRLGASPSRVLIYVRSPDAVAQIAHAIEKGLGDGGGTRVARLTGTIRGKERDELAESEVFRAFKAGADRSSLLPHALYLASTSAGEVGADLDADHLVCDLSTLDSLAQRFGRVNRLGGDGRSARIVVVRDEIPDKDPLAVQRRNTAEVLKDLPAIRGSRESAPEYDASPAALTALLAKPEAQAAFSPVPKILPATDILFDHWSLTSIGLVKGPDDRWRDALPGRPAVEPYLHGVEDEKQWETHVAWRADLADLALAAKRSDSDEEDLSVTDLQRVLDVFPLRSAEQLRDRTDRVYQQLEVLAERWRKSAKTVARSHIGDVQAESEPDSEMEPDAEADDERVLPTKVPSDPWVVLMRNGTAWWARLSKIVPESKQEKDDVRRLLAFATLVLPVQVGGLKDGMLDGNQPAPGDSRVLDVAEAPIGGKSDRHRVVGNGDNGSESLLMDGSGTAAQAEFLPRHTVVLATHGEDEEPSKVIEYRVAKGQEREPGERVLLEDHNAAVGAAASRTVEALGLPDDLKIAFALAGRLHDLGKGRDRWQRFANNPRPSNPNEPYDLIAKNKRYRDPRTLRGYRHELGSLHDASAESDIQSLDPSTRDLVLHLIAAHHGWARPHFESRHFDPGDPSPGKPRPTADNERLAVETMQRFARLQQRYGRWGLAWLESILRCADAAASESPAPADNGAGTSSKREGTPGGAA